MHGGGERLDVERRVRVVLIEYEVAKAVGVATSLVVIDAPWVLHHEREHRSGQRRGVVRRRALGLGRASWRGHQRRQERHDRRGDLVRAAARRARRVDDRVDGRARQAECDEERARREKQAGEHEGGDSAKGLR